MWERHDTWMSSVHCSTALPGQCCLRDNIHPRTKELCSTNFLSNQVSLLVMSHVWGNIVGKIAFVTLWTMILTGASGAKETKGRTSIPTSVFLSPVKELFQFTSRFLWPIPLGNGVILGTVSASGATGHSPARAHSPTQAHSPARAVTLTWVKGYACLDWA